MEDTQELDDQLESFPEDTHDADDLQIGSLKVSHADGKLETHPLYTGQNFVARRSAQRHRDEDKIQAWKRDNPGAALHGIFLESASVSSPHAIIYVEARGNFCFVKDLGSKNKTLMEGSTGTIVLQTGDRYAVHSGAAVKFGNIGCTIHYSAQPGEVPPAAEAPAQAAPAGQEATQAYDAVEPAAAEGVPQHSGGQLQSAQAAVAASAAAPATAAPLQVRSLPPHLHAAKRPPAGPPSKPPQPRTRPTVIIPPPNAWPTAPLHLPGQPSLPSQAMPEQQREPVPWAPVAAVPKHEAEQPQASGVQHATAWASFQQNAAVSMQRAHSMATASAFQAAPTSEKPSSSRRSLDSLSPFASASQEGPEWSDLGDVPGASVPVPVPLTVRGSIERDSSLKNISSIASLRDWGASKGVPRRVSTERLPSLQDWMLPLCISSPPSSAPKADAMSRTCSQDLLCSEAMPRAEHFVQWACNASARPSALPRHSHDVLERMPNAFPEALPLSVRSDSVPPKRSRGSDAYKDDSPTAQAATQQRPKSPRLARSALSSSFTLGVSPRCARSGSPHSGAHNASAAAYAGYPGPLDGLWGAGSDGTCHVRLPSPTTAS